MTQADQVRTLIDKLRGDAPWRDFARTVGVRNYSNLIRWRRAGKLGLEGKNALSQFLKRSLDDFDEYLQGKYSLDEFLDPQFGLDQQVGAFTIEMASRWIRYRTTLTQKIRLHRELTEQIGAIALAGAVAELKKSFDELLASQEYQGLSFDESLKQIADQVGLQLSRLKEFYEGKDLPCEDEVIALAPLIGDVEELRRFYVTGLQE